MVLSLYGIPDKLIKVISAMYENNTFAVKALRVQGARIGLKINIKKTKSLRLGIS